MWAIWAFRQHPGYAACSKLQTQLSVISLVGIAAYVLYKELLGEFLLYPARHMLHTAAAKAVHRARQGRAPEAGSVGSVPALLGSLGVPIGQRQWVYRSLRTTTLLSEPQKRSLDLFHSEIHVLYISAVELLAAGAYGATTQKPVAWAFWLAGALLFSAYIIDWRMDFLDAAFMRNQRIAVSKALEELGFPKRGV